MNPSTSRKTYFMLFVLTLLLAFNNTYALTPLPDLKGITIGTSYDRVIEAWGKPNRVIGEYVNGCGLLNFQNDYFLGNFVYGKVWNLALRFDEIAGSGNGVSRKTAHVIRKQLLPPDAKFVRRSRLNNGADREDYYVYISPSLTRCFQPHDFYDLELAQDVPGEFLVTYQCNSRGKVTAVTIGVGNNP